MSVLTISELSIHTGRNYLMRNTDSAKIAQTTLQTTLETDTNADEIGQ